MEVQKVLERKKKLKDGLKGECCILKRFKKNKENDSDQVLYFFSQVDMKLVTRVLNMSRLTTDQLVWCHNKLSSISFLHRKIHINLLIIVISSLTNNHTAQKGVVSTQHIFGGNNCFESSSRATMTRSTADSEYDRTMSYGTESIDHIPAYSWLRLDQQLIK
ncbi:hypothetical protein H5410_006825 [Solanum commersonii]|uniref:Uncharacterized protein n=1 Tax=Solanum commersonii TaxID=4109 RepID=A0A9J6ACF0_SOLCO|nr:hypothetical protein H5410_006825 [Solanum commersonii]